MLQKALLSEEFTAADETMCEEAADQSTNREQAADNCERDIDKLYIASYMQQFIGEEFDAEVSGVQSFGVFVALENGCEGLIRAELMTGDFYQYDEEHMAMVGRHTGKRFTIGTPMRVKLLAQATPPVRSTLHRQTARFRFRKSWIVRAVRTPTVLREAIARSAAVTAARDAAASPARAKSRPRAREDKAIPHN